MSGFFMLIILILFTHFLFIVWFAYNAQKLLACRCGRRFNIPDDGEYNCPRCGEYYPRDELETLRGR